MESAITFVVTNADALMVAGIAVVAAAAAIAKLTPTPKDDAVVSKVQSALLFVQSVLSARKLKLR